MEKGRKGHLMGKKSIEEEQEVNPDSDYLTALKAARLTQILMQALMQPQNPNQMMPQTADRLLQRHWREEDREKYLAEMSDLLLLALKLQDSDST
ncbi:gastrin-releasing peptide isoform X2 [Oreochromis niloticus]|uniref:gastrin-releasing peptide isoform X2 n=1 Tax=Oreochromis niloticus TaxID=8128 RepID=UPI000674E6D0|nr:gastrin-releasing peptide isoform X2 [Oreochromis niloticus]